MAGPALPLLLSKLWMMMLASSEARTRTENRPVNSRMLCQLSYLGLGFPWVFRGPGHLEPNVTALPCNFSLRGRSSRLSAGRSAD